jgi:hypothetical protein
MKERQSSVLIAPLRLMTTPLYATPFRAIRRPVNGPTAAVVEDGYVAFNTESCAVIVAEAKTGNQLFLT